MKSIPEIAHEFRIKYGLGDNEPTRAQLIDILNRTAEWEQRRGVQADDASIKTIVHQVCATAGKFKYASLGYQYMRELLIQLQTQVQTQQKR